jgi:general secretion pathway protein D
MKTLRLAFLCLLLCGCATGSRAPAPVKPSNTPAPSPPPTSTSAAPPATPKPQPMLVPGTGAFTRAAPPKIATEANADAAHAFPAQDEFELSFIDTEVGVVVASVLGDGLGLSYVVDPAVKGTMTLQAAHTLRREEVLPALENALRLYGIAMVDVNGTYNVVPMVDARRRALRLREAGDASVGYGIQIVQLQYVSATDIEKTLRSVTSEGSIVRVDEGRNLLLLAGTSQERAAMLDMIKTFDVDWLAGMSFAVFPFEYMDAKTAADELTHVFAEEKSPIANVVRFIPLSRLNAILVVSYQPHYLQEVEGWIRRLDVGTTSAGRRIYVYDVQNGKADELAKALAGVLSLGGGVGSDTGAPTGLSNSSSFGSSSSSFGSSSASSSGFGNPTGSQSLGTTGNSSGSGMSGFDSQRSGGDRFGNGTSAGGQPRGSGAASGSSGMSIAPNIESNSLMIYASPAEFAMIESALKRMDVRPLQVMIEATLAEVTLTDQLRFGVQWSYLSQKGPVTFSESSSGAIAQQFPGLSFLYTGSSDINAVLSSLETLTHVKVLSTPRLLVLNNREAELKIGDQVPIITQSAVGTLTSNSTIVNSVELKDTGVILRVIPRVNKNGLVTLDVSQEVSDVGATTTSSINSPTIHQRQMSSTVEVRDGETIAMGGLIRESLSTGRDGLPLLSRIPVLGALFGSTSREKDRTELIVLLAPHVIRSSEDSAELMDDLRNKFRSLRDVLPPASHPK